MGNTQKLGNLVNGLYVDTNGSVGIGTTSMSSEGNLFLGAKSTLEGGQIVLQKGTTQTLAAHLDNYSDRFRILKGSDTGTTAELMVVNLSNGNVGIGTSSPSYTLDVTGTGTFRAANGVNIIGPTGNPAYLTTDQSVNNGGKRWRIGHTGAASGFSSFDIYNQTDNILGMTITSTGNVGIGTSSPVLTGTNRTTVDISGVSQSLLVLSTGSTWKSYFYNDGTNLSIANNGGNTIFDNGGERMRITATGKIGFNTSSPFNAYTFKTGTGNNLDIFDTGSSFGIGMQAVNDANTAYKSWDFYATKYYFSANISGEIANFSSSSALAYLKVGSPNISGAQAGIYLECAGIFGGGIYVDRSTQTVRVWNGSSSTGVQIQGSGTSWGSYSDERLKDIIEPITGGLNKVNSLRPIIGKYKTDEADKRRAFLIAQDVLQVLPEAVYDDKSEDKILSLQYTDVIPLLVNAIQELSAKVNQLENK